MLKGPTLSAPRTTITRGWRPAGQPKCRVVEFCEVENDPVPAAIEPAPVIERRSIGRRLENWGMWANMHGRIGGRGSDCMTAVICDDMRRNALGELHAPAPVNDRIDVPDAECINASIVKIDEAHRWVLHWTYVVCARPWGVAGACGFPTREYAARLLAAQEAIEVVSTGSGGRRA